ncbi:hypothetical protein HQQ81_12925 [Microbacteriaceae bacterium VKM Ac-2854]|nr:hypothetical protein [Microbacteriaceae bacterium VKM Ac-2854]
MRTLIRQWAAFAALGAGLVHIALGAGSAAGPAIALIGAGAVELLWAVLVLARGRILAPRASATVATAYVGAWIAAILIGDGFGVDPLPMLAAVLLDLAVAGIAIASLRSPGVDRDPTAGRMLVGAFAGALIVAGIATPALAATPAGGGDMGGMHMTVPAGHSH